MMSWCVSVWLLFGITFASAYDPLHFSFHTTHGEQGIHTLCILNSTIHLDIGPQDAWLPVRAGKFTAHVRWTHCLSRGAAALTKYGVDWWGRMKGQNKILCKRNARSEQVVWNARITGRQHPCDDVLGISLATLGCIRQILQML